MSFISARAGLLFGTLSVGLFAALFAACGGDDSTQPIADSGPDVPVMKKDAQPPADVDNTIDSGQPDVVMRKLVTFVGGYGPNISVFGLDDMTGALTPIDSQPSFGPSPSFLAVHPTGILLFALSESTDGGVGSYYIDPKTGKLMLLNNVSSGGSGPAHLSVDGSGKWVLVANYGDGTVSSLPIDQMTGQLGAPVSTVMAGTKPHQAQTDPSNHFLFVPCLGSDYVAQFTFDDMTGKITPNSVPHFATAMGAGPRHIAWAPNGHTGFLVNETDSTLMSLDLDQVQGQLSAKQTVSTLPMGYMGQNTAAEVVVHPSGAWVYVSNRGADAIVQYTVGGTGLLTMVNSASSGGKTPRHMALDPKSDFLLVADQDSNSVVTFAVDQGTGALTQAMVTAPTVTQPTMVRPALLPPPM